MRQQGVEAIRRGARWQVDGALINIRARLKD
jgi:hypothetical protein